MKYLTLILPLFILSACTGNQKPDSEEEAYSTEIILDKDEANRLAALPLKCIQNPLPYKSGHVIAKAEDLDMPENHHPAFYGCFDWHSAVHGHWSLVFLMKEFPDLDSFDVAVSMLDQNLTKENIEKELAYFSMNRYTKSFERTYGWAWLLKLAEELYTWNHPLAGKWYENLNPLTDYISEQYITYLPKLVYPIRVGEHSNTAFGLSFAHDYAVTTGDSLLKNSIEENALRFYSLDKGCPINWEPSGYDFLSPCLQEIDIMRKILDSSSFDRWINEFMPQLSQKDFTLEPGKIIDRSDGKLVHLDGLNFSRAWCLYPLTGKSMSSCRKIADQHMQYSLDKIRDGDYSGEHWLASFALYAYKTKLDSK